MATLIKSKERVSNHGEVFTPKYIVLEMISLIPDDIWSDKEYICLEPTCGNGNFVTEIVKKKISSGLSVFDSVNTTFGMDIMEDNIFECRKRVFDICSELILDKKELFHIACVIVNNIFVVSDSLSYIKDNQWESKKFFDYDPVKEYGDKGLNKFFKKKHESQVLSSIEQKEIKNQTNIFLKQVNYEI